MQSRASWTILHYIEIYEVHTAETLFPKYTVSQKDDIENRYSPEKLVTEIIKLYLTNNTD